MNEPAAGGGRESEAVASPRRAAQAASFRLQLRLFGPLDVRVHGQPLAQLHSRKGRWALALLALRAGKEVDRQWLAETLWPESAAPQAFYNLRQHLSELRGALGDQAARLHAPSRRTLCLDLSGAWLDVAAFDAAVARGDRHALEEAVALYRGPLLEGCQEEWVLPEREGRAQAYLQALERLAEAAAARGETAAAVALLRRALSADPLRETAARALMEAFSAQEELAAAVEVYRELRLRLYQELNTAPAPETAALFETIRRLAGNPSPPPRLRAVRPAGAGSRLPHPLTPLIGRERELEQVRVSLGETRLVTLTGSGGVGKTRLALAAAAAVQAKFAHGAWFIDLAPLGDPALVPQAAVAALGLRGEDRRPPVERLLAELRQKSVLLVLDNCEHVLDAAARLTGEVLAGCPEVRILATSRQPLGLPGEIAWRVPSLAVPDERDLEEVQQSQANRGPETSNRSTLLDFDAVRLFVQRAAEAAPGLQASAAELVAISRICRRLDGVPLAIELAAARVGDLPVPQILARLNDRFRLLTGGSRAALPRQQTLRATLDWSYQLLSEPERTLLHRLTVFAGGWTLEAAEAVGGVGRVPAERVEGLGVGEDAPPNPQPLTPNPRHEVLDLLTSLVDKSLVLYEPGGERYRLLETVRQYAAEQLAHSGEERAVRRRHLGYFAAVAGELGKLDHGERLDEIDALAMEQENLRSALAWSLAEEPEVGLRLAISLDRFWRWRSRLGEGFEWVQRLLAACPEPAGELRATAYVKLAIWTEWRGAFAAAGEWYRRGLAAARAAGDAMYAALALYGLGLICRQQGDFRQAAVFAEESAAVSRSAGRDRDFLRAQTELGSLYHCLGDDERAYAVLVDCLELARRLGDPRFTAVALDQLGDLARDRSECASARAFYLEKLAVVRAAGLHELMVYTINDLGLLDWQTGDLAAAGARLEEALAVARRLDSPMLQTICLLHVARLAYVKGDREPLRAAARESLELAWQGQEMGRVVPALHRLAVLAAVRDEAARAVRLLAAADRIEAAHGPVTLFAAREFRAEVLALARARLDEPAFLAAQAEGEALPTEQTVQDALRWAASLATS